MFNITEDKNVKEHKRTLISDVVLMSVIPCIRARESMHGNSILVRFLFLSLSFMHCHRLCVLSFAQSSTNPLTSLSPRSRLTYVQVCKYALT